MPYFKHALENENLNSYCAGYVYFKDGSAENSDLFRCGKAVAFPNEKYNNKIEILVIPIMKPLAGFLISNCILKIMHVRMPEINWAVIEPSLSGLKVRMHAIAWGIEPPTFW